MEKLQYRIKNYTTTPWKFESAAKRREYALDSFKAKESFTPTHVFFERTDTKHNWAFDPDTGQVAITRQLKKDLYEVVYLDAQEISSKVIVDRDTRSVKAKSASYGTKLLGGFLGGAVGATIAGAVGTEYKTVKVVERIQLDVTHKTDESVTYNELLYNSIEGYQADQYLRDPGYIDANRLCNLVKEAKTSLSRKTGTVQVPEKTEKVEKAGRVEQPASVASNAEQYLKEIDGIYLAPDIPARKMRGAGKKLLQQADPEDKLIGLIDTTLFGGGADGVAIFEKYIVYADIAAESTRYFYDDLKNPHTEDNSKEVTAEGINIKLYGEDRARAFSEFLKSMCPRE